MLTPRSEVTNLGVISDDRQLATLYAAADIMVVPSRQEAFGKTLIEAMACGTPVVAFGDGGPVDIVDHMRTGYLARPFDPATLAEGILWCLESGDRRDALGRAARRKVEDHFDAAFVGRRYLDHYHRVLERRT